MEQPTHVAETGDKQQAPRGTAAWLRTHSELAGIIVLIALAFVFALAYELGAPRLGTGDVTPQPGSEEPTLPQESRPGVSEVPGASAGGEPNKGVTPLPDEPVVSSPTEPRGPQDVPPSDAVPVTITGTFTCLPKKGTGPQTMECAFGVRESATGNHYALRVYGDIPPGGLEGEGERTYTGLLSRTLPPGNTYDIAGILFVQSVR